MTGAILRSGAAILLALTPLASQAATPVEPPLSSAQNKVVSKSIAKLKWPEERKLAAGWSNAKKVAEVICRPAALPVLKKEVSGANRVFLGTDDPATLTLVSDKTLIGSGQVRSGADWTEFSFTCQLDPKTGKASAFKVSMKPAG